MWITDILICFLEMHIIKQLENEHSTYIRKKVYVFTKVGGGRMYNLLQNQRRNWVSAVWFGMVAFMMFIKELWSNGGGNAATDKITFTIRNLWTIRCNLILFLKKSIIFVFNTSSFQ